MKKTIAAVVIGFVILLPAYWLALRTPAVGLYHDDGVYLVTAKALATGQGYRIISLPSEIHQTKYPFLFPLTLAAVWKLFPDFPENVFVLKLVPFLFAVMWLGLSYWWLRSEGMPKVTALLIILLTAASPTVMYFSSALLSETMFAALCVAALLVLRRAERGSGGLLAVYGSGMLVGLAALTRTAGLPLALAGVGALCLRRGWKMSARFFIAFGILYLPWMCWVASHPSSQLTDAYYSSQNYGGWNIFFNFTWPQKAAIAGWNTFLVAAAPLTQAGVIASIAPLAGIVAVYGFVRHARSQMNVVHLFLAIYVAMLVCWAWPPERFVVVVLPVVLFFIWQGIATMVNRNRVAQIGTLLLAAILFGVSAQSAYASALKSRQTGIFLSENEHWRDTSLLSIWIRDHTRPDAILLGNLDPMFYLYTGRKSVRGFYAHPYLLFYGSDKSVNPLGSGAALRESIRRQRANYVVVTPNERFSEKQYIPRVIAELEQSRPDALRLVYQGRSEEHQVYEVGSGLSEPTADTIESEAARRQFPVR